VVIPTLVRSDRPVGLWYGTVILMPDTSEDSCGVGGNEPISPETGALCYMPRAE